MGVRRPGCLPDTICSWVRHKHAVGRGRGASEERGPAVFLETDEPRAPVTAVGRDRKFSEEWGLTGFFPDEPRAPVAAVDRDR